MSMMYTTAWQRALSLHEHVLIIAHYIEHAHTAPIVLYIYIYKYTAAAACWKWKWKRKWLKKLREKREGTRWLLHSRNGVYGLMWIVDGIEMEFFYVHMHGYVGEQQQQQLQKAFKCVRNSSVVCSFGWLAAWIDGWERSTHWHSDSRPTDEQMRAFNDFPAHSNIVRLITTGMRVCVYVSVCVMFCSSRMMIIICIY